MYLKYEMYAELLDWADAMSQQVYETPMLHYRMHQFAALIRKYPSIPNALRGNQTPRRNAQDTFLAAEHRCKRVNQRFRAIRSTGRDPYASEKMHARNWIMYVLRDKPNFNMIYEGCDITPGACIGVHGNATNLARKLSSESWTMTPSALPFAAGALWANAQIRELVLRDAKASPSTPVCLDKDLFARHLLKRLQMVHHNKISFVPKTAKTDRSIAVEPFVNSYLQRGVDQSMRMLLKRVGLDLADQSRNQELARQGSFDEDNGYCTIDLSSASDTLAKEVVWELLPVEWAETLNCLRSRSYKWIDGSQKEYHKFTSMGNGFCFPLETLIFASLCHAAYVSMNLDPDFRVYGDDIIVRKDVAVLVLDLLDHCGFIPNRRKTFTKGPFRESCGADWHGGVNVRPIYLDHELTSLTQIYGFHNQSLRRESYVQHYFAEIREYLFETLPDHAQLVCPYDPSFSSNEGNQLDEQSSDWSGTTIDGAFWVSFDRFMASKYARWNRNTQSWGWISLLETATPDKQFLPRRDGQNDFVHLIGALRGANSEVPFTLRYSPRTKAVMNN